ncbi:hypothetical protein FRC07_006419 [Ceratobasidium sp. 392]|nr:hypothetical protein FRC07_006419 [Ceratobasidium sp. 392]
MAATGCAGTTWLDDEGGSKRCGGGEGRKRLADSAHVIPTHKFRITSRFVASNARARNFAARHWYLVQAHSPAHPATRYVIEQEATKAAIMNHTGLRATTDVEPVSVLKMPSEVVVRGVKIPPRPKPPESDECCMSGCVVCVYDLYLSALEDYKQSLTSARSLLESRFVPLSEWPDEVREAQPQGDEQPLDSLDLDPSMKAFLILEKKLGQKIESYRFDV